MSGLNGSSEFAALFMQVEWGRAALIIRRVLTSALRGAHCGRKSEHCVSVDLPLHLFGQMERAAEVDIRN